MIALFLLLAAQAATPTADAAPPDAPPPASLPTASSLAQRRACHRAPGSDTITCDVTAQQQGGYRLPRYGPGAPHADNGKSVKLGAQVTNKGPARRKRSMATVGIPF